jgi:hypothetical protein
LFSVFIYNRTDNAVKNRFSTLCKRRAKDDEPFQENGTPCSNTNAKRVLTKTGCVTPGAAGSSLPMKQIRYTKYQQHLYVSNLMAAVFVPFLF